MDAASTRAVYNLNPFEETDEQTQQEFQAPILVGIPEDRNYSTRRFGDVSTEQEPGGQPLRPPPGFGAPTNSEKAVAAGEARAKAIIDAFEAVFSAPQQPANP